MKKIGFLTLLILVTALVTLAFTAAAAPAPPPHPHIHEALEAMHSAKGHLDAAEGDFHGHRAKAIEHLNQAIHEAEICEQEP